MRLRFVLSETAKGMYRNLAMTVSVILVAFVSLLFVGASSLLQSQISTMKGDWYDKVEVSIFLCSKGSDTPSCAGGAVTDAQRDQIRTDLEGLRVRNREGVEFGTVSHLFETPGNPVMVVQGERERLIPFLLERFVDSVDLDAGEIVVDWDADF